jgi:hypothetical protein
VDLNRTAIDYEPNEWSYYDELNPVVVGYFNGTGIFDGLERLAFFDGRTFRVVFHPGCSACMVTEFKSGTHNALFVSRKVTMLTYETVTMFDGGQFRWINITGDSIHVAYIPSRDSWLIYLRNGGDLYENSLYLYDGSLEKLLNFSEGFKVYSMDSNGSVVLLATNYGLYSYNGTINKISTMDVYLVRWDGCWMLATSGGLFTYDGRNFTKITDPGIRIVYITRVNDFWLIAGVQKGQWRLLKYHDGTFEDLTSELLNAKPWPPSDSDHLLQGSHKRRIICLVCALMLFSLLLLLKRRV